MEGGSQMNVEDLKARLRALLHQRDDFRIPDTGVYNSDGTDPDDEAMTVPEIYRSRIRDTI
jgi:hypothetical protein